MRRATRTSAEWALGHLLVAGTVVIVTRIASPTLGDTIVMSFLAYGPTFAGIAAVRGIASRDIVAAHRMMVFTGMGGAAAWAVATPIAAMLDPLIGGRGEIVLWMLVYAIAATVFAVIQHHALKPTPISSISWIGVVVVGWVFTAFAVSVLVDTGTLTPLRAARAFPGAGEQSVLLWMVGLYGIVTAAGIGRLVTARG